MKVTAGRRSHQNEGHIRVKVTPGRRSHQGEGHIRVKVTTGRNTIHHVTSKSHVTVTDTATYVTLCLKRIQEKRRGEKIE